MAGFRSVSCSVSVMPHRNDNSIAVKIPVRSHKDGKDRQIMERGRKSRSFIAAGILCRGPFIVLYLNIVCLFTIKGFPILGRVFVRGCECSIVPD